MSFDHHGRLRGKQGDLYWLSKGVLGAIVLSLVACGGGTHQSAGAGVDFTAKPSVSFAELNLNVITPETVTAIAARRIVDAPDCTAPTPEAEPGTKAWRMRDKANRYCAILGSLDFYRNSAISAVHARAQAARATKDPNGAAGSYSGDPFREPLSRWHGIRGRYDSITYRQPNGDDAMTRYGAIFRPLAECSGGDTTDCPAGLPRVAGSPYPGVMLVCHWCSLSQAGEGGFSHSREGADVYIWIAETLAEAGYLVMAAPVFRDAETQVALNYLLSTPEQPTELGDVNPFWQELDRERIGMMGHSGAASRSLENGQRDARVKAIVSLDRSRSFDPRGVELTTPSLFITGDADYFYHENIVPLDDRPSAPPGSKWADLDLFREAGVPGMMISLRAGTHGEFHRSVVEENDETVGNCRVCGRYGQTVAAYYTLAWFDHYLKGAPGAMPRLTASLFDGSADIHSIGMGYFDSDKARAAGDIAAGNVPVTIEGLAVEDALSFYRPSAWYFGDAENQRCDDMRRGLNSGECGARDSGLGSRDSEFSPTP